jgi:predicted site-specific integrase-resolvase
MTNLVPAENQSDKAALPKLAYSMREAAEIIGVSYMTMHRLLQRGLLKSCSALRTKVIPYSEIQRFLSSNLE